MGRGLTDRRTRGRAGADGIGPRHATGTKRSRRVPLCASQEKPLTRPRLRPEDRVPSRGVTAPCRKARVASGYAATEVHRRQGHDRVAMSGCRYPLPDDPAAPRNSKHQTTQASQVFRMSPIWQPIRPGTDRPLWQRRCQTSLVA
jgi:hypothetical protein